MGTTYLVDQRVEAILSPDGEPYYMMFKKTFESNVYPKLPHWSVVYFGPIRDCMRWAIVDASYCEDGMLQREDGPVSPTEHLANWRRAFACPRKFPARQLQLTSVLLERIRDIRPSLIASGVLVSDGTVSLELPRHAAQLHQIVEAGVPLWRFNLPARRASALSPLVHAPNEACPPPAELAIWYTQEKNWTNSFEKIYWLLQDGRFVNCSWRSSLLRRLICSVAVAAEATAPGSAERSIDLLRIQVDLAKEIPRTQPVHIRFEPTVDSFAASNYNEIRHRLGVPAGLTFETTMGAILDSGSIECFHRLPDQMIHFPGLVPSAEPAGASSPNSVCT